MQGHDFYMQRCIALAMNGKGRVSPNPIVGAVIVHEGHIIGEGWHRQYGGPHAELNAIEAVQDKQLLLNSTIYVSLEPCAHWGKTPPCAERIIREGIPRVVIGCGDPFAKVNGKGIEMLKQAGIAVTENVLEEECRMLNRRFFTYHAQHRPYIILKWAQTADQYIARANYDSRWISNEWSRALVHQWRGEEDAVMVGYNTALYDNPQLNTRGMAGKNPIRIVADRKGTLPEGHHLLDNSIGTIVFTDKPGNNTQNIIYLPYPANIAELWHVLYAQNIQSLIVEGGSKLLKQVIDSTLWDEMRVFTSTQSFGSGIAAPPVSGELRETHSIGDDMLHIFSNTL